MKYVIFKQKQLLPVIIPEHVTHSQIKIVGAKPISAGFFENESGIVNTFGKSESLNLKSKPEDARIIESTLYNAPTSSFLDFN